MRLLYNLLFLVALVLLLPGYLRRLVRRGNYRKNFGQRLGFYSLEVGRRLERLQRPMWIEAVSVGEMLVALRLVSALRKRDPNLSLVLSTTTTTGYALATERIPEGVEVLYTPIDLYGAVRRAFDAINPSQLIIADGGLWPNQIWEAHARRIPITLVNARLSPRSARRFRRFQSLVRPLFSLLDLVCVTDAPDVKCWQELGLAAGKIQLIGSIKFDYAAYEDNAGKNSGKNGGNTHKLRRYLQDDLGISDHAPVLLAGSTHPGEERLLGEIFIRLRQAFPELLLVVAPRHVERSRGVRMELEKLGLKVRLRTAPVLAHDQLSNVLLLDTTGELRDWYSVATLVFIGKSICADGGQNPVEAIAADVPVVCGPNMQNFEALVKQLLENNAAAQVQSSDDLEKTLRHLLWDETGRSSMAAAAKKQIAVHLGATERTADLLLRPKQNFACKSA